MADASVQGLRDAFANAPSGPVMLNDTFWTGAGLVPPAGFTASIKAAYRLPSAAAGLTIGYDRAAVTPVADDRFSIPGVTLAFLTAPAGGTSATIRGGLGVPSTPILGIDVTPSGWQLADLFPEMAPVNWPFSMLALDQQRFFFTTAPQVYAWAGQGAVLPLAAGQNLYGMLSLPAQALPLFALVPGLSNLPTALVACGPIVLDQADNADILFPDMDIRAALPAGSGLKLFFLDVVGPHLGFVVQTALDSADQDGAPFITEAGDPIQVAFQTPFLYFGVGIAVTGADDSRLPLALRATIDQQATSYAFSIGPADPSLPITAASIGTLMAGDSFIQDVPPLLQEYLASVQMQGFSLAGPLQPSIGLSSVSAMLGSVQGQPIPLFSDPTTGQAFELDAFSLAWSISQPLAAAQRWSSVRLQASFKLFPELFRTKDGKPGGLFEIAIDQSLDFEGSFAGSVTLSDVLSTITGGALGLPAGVSVGFSDVLVKVSPSRRAYSLGFTVDAFVDVPFVRHTDPISGEAKPLIQISGLVFNLAASTPSGAKGQNGVTVYAGSMDGQIVVGPFAANVHVDYDGTRPLPVWTLAASLAEPLALSDLIAQFFRAYDLPTFLPGTLTIEALAVRATIPVTPKAGVASGQGVATRPGWRIPVRPLVRAGSRRHLALLGAVPATKPAYSVSTRIRWVFDLTADITVDILADLSLDYDGNRKAGEEFAGAAIGTIEINQIGPVQIGYSFGPPAAKTAGAMLALAGGRALTASNDTLWISWKGVRAEYLSATQTVTFTLKGWTVGSLITSLMEMVFDPYFTLPDPWDVLNSISLDGFSLSFNLTPGAKNRVSASYTLASEIDLGFFSVQGLSFLQVDGKVTLAIKGSVRIPGLADQPLFKPDSGGQDVKQMPAVPGRGNSYFDLRLLALGQRIAIDGAGSFTSTQQVIKALQSIPSSGKDSIPFDPTLRKKGQPYYDPTANWLGALSLGLLRIDDKPSYAVDVMVVFSDPGLYGLRIALSGDKMKVLAGLAIDVLYKKVTDDIGCYQIEFTLPSVLRNLDFGAFAVTLPVIGLQIYTNGDFLIDFGFPYNMDFSRSFTAQAIILGIPVLGSGGFYFGKLSNATAPNLPVTSKGTFHPVIVFGLGVQLGFGRTIDKGILKAGFSITVFGIIEGTIAAWHPSDAANRGDPSQVQGDYYFKISGSFGIIGKLYGSIDFAIIKADISLTVMVYAQITYESCRKIPMSLSASVQVSVSIKIDLGLFSFSISLSFSASISEQLTVGSDSTAPWDGAADVRLTARNDALLSWERTRPLPRTLFEHGIAGAPLRLDFARPHAVLLAGRLAVGPVAIELTALTQFTVLAPEGAGYAQQEGGLVLLFAMDAPTAGSAGGDGTSFGKLCGALLPWIIASVTPDVSVPLPPLQPGTVSRPLLEGILLALADPATAPFTAAQLVAFLAATVTLTVSAADATLDSGRKALLDKGSAIFPALPFLSLTVPDPNATSGTVSVQFDAYATATPGYQAALRTIFNSVAANVGREHRAGLEGAAVANGDPQPIASCVFADYFVLLSRQLVQGALDSFDDYPYPLTDRTTLQSILVWAAALAPGQLTASALLTANLAYPLTPGQPIGIDAVSYMVQTGDTLAAIAGRYADAAAPGSTNPAGLILANRAQSNLLAPGATISVTADGTTRSYVTVVGDSFDRAALEVGLTTEQLSQQAGLYAQTGLLAAAVVTTIPDVVHTTQSGDTLGTVLARFHVPVTSVITTANLALANLFKVDPALRFAVPGLVVLPQDALWPAVVATGTLGQTAGTASRTMLHGMRLPVAAGLAVPTTGFLYGAPHWPAAQSAYGAYQLTGQQVPLVPRTGAYPMAISRPTGPAYDWVTLGGGASVDFDIGAQAALLGQVVAAAQSQGYKPAIPLLTPEPATVLAARRFGMATHTPWATSDMASLAAITRPLAGRVHAVVAAGAGPQAKPLLFTCPAPCCARSRRCRRRLPPPFRP